MKARLGLILNKEQHQEREKNPGIECCRVEIDILQNGKGVGFSDGWHHTAIILYADTVQHGARIGLACVDAINALKDEVNMR